MSQRLRSQPDLADVVALAWALEHEEQRPRGDIADWEKRLAQTWPAPADDRTALALAWLDAHAVENPELATVHRRAATALHFSGAIVAFAGILVGWGATLAAFYFDGTGRVNAVAVLAVLVALPAALLLPFVLAALPARVVGRLPGAAPLAAGARAFSPGRLAPVVWRIFPRHLRDALALVSGRMRRHHELYRPLQKWALLRWSQLFAVWFHLTAVAVCLGLVVFTDLAFGWSTTLTTGDAGRDAARVHRAASALAAPWSRLWPDAVPPLALVEESRYYRVAAGSVSPAQAGRLGGWWRFVVLCLAAYGLGPRLVTYAIARYRLRAAARAAVLNAPGLSGVVRRIHRARIETAAPQPESAGEEPPAPPAGIDGRHSQGPVRAVIAWAGVPVDAGAVAAAFPDAPLFAAGGTATVERDAAVAQQVRAAAAAPDAEVVVLVKAWEPPLMEFLDFVRLVRDALPRATPITVLPAGLGEAGRLAPAGPAQLKLWRDKLAAAGDPWLRVAADPGEARS